MFIILDGKSKRVRAWYRSHVYHMYNFRVLFEEEQTTPDPKKKQQIHVKQERARKKVEQHMTYGKSLAIDEAQMRQFNLAIVEEVKKRKKPQEIIQTLIRQGNGQK